MRQFTIAAATVAIAALISAAPASAERIQGGPIKQNGKCWKDHVNSFGCHVGRLGRLPAAGRRPRDPSADSPSGLSGFSEQDLASGPVGLYGAFFIPGKSRSPASHGASGSGWQNLTPERCEEFLAYH